MSITLEQVNGLDDKVREIGKFLGMEFDEEYAQKHERDWAYWGQLKNGNKIISFHTGDFKIKDRWQIRGEFPGTIRAIFSKIITTANIQKSQYP